MMVGFADHCDLALLITSTRFGLSNASVLWPPFFVIPKSSSSSSGCSMVCYMAHLWARRDAQPGTVVHRKTSTHVYPLTHDRTGRCASMRLDRRTMRQQLRTTGVLRVAGPRIGLIPTMIKTNRQEDASSLNTRTVSGVYAACGLVT